jgi:hypothetical protein
MVDFIHPGQVFVLRLGFQDLKWATVNNFGRQSMPISPENPLPLVLLRLFLLCLSR